MKIYQRLINRKGGKQFAVLIDPDKFSEKHISETIGLAETAGVDYFFVGGSHILHDYTDECINLIRETTSIPIVIFPGNAMQINDKADAILLLSVISGRNPEMLIGQHVIAAPYLKASKLEIIPAGYILIESGSMTSVSYLSNTLPIPSDKYDIAISTAMAGEMLGLKLIYLEAGSGAKYPVSPAMIKRVRENISVPLIVGGGIRSPETAGKVLDAGADLIVVGNAFEDDYDKIAEIADVVKKMNS